MIVRPHHFPVGPPGATRNYFQEVRAMESNHRDVEAFQRYVENLEARVQSMQEVIDWLRSILRELRHESQERIERYGKRTSRRPPP